MGCRERGEGVGVGVGGELELFGGEGADSD